MYFYELKIGKLYRRNGRNSEHEMRIPLGLVSESVNDFKVNRQVNTLVQDACGFITLTVHDALDDGFELIYEDKS